MIDNYNFYIDSPIDGRQEVYPVNSALKWVNSQVKELNIKEKNLDTTLIFQDKGQDKSFTYFQNIIQNKQHYFPFKLEVYKNNVEYWIGKFEILTADNIDLDNCIIKIKPSANNMFTCLAEKWNDKIDLFDYGTIKEVLPFDGDLEYIETINKFGALSGVYQQFDTDKISDVDYLRSIAITSQGANWKPFDVYYYDYNLIEDLHDEYISDVHEYGKLIIKWVRLSNGNPSPTYFINLDINKVQQLYDGELRYNQHRSTYRIFTESSFERTMNLNSVIQNVFSDCGITIHSDFFGINADSTAPTNQYYTDSASYLQNLHISDISDIAINGSDGSEVVPASKQIVKFGNFIQGLANFADCDYYFTGGKFRLEHKTYQQKLLMLDLSSNIMIKNKRNYKFAQQGLVKTIKFGWEVETDGENRHYDGFNIENPLSVADGESTVSLSPFVTNLKGIYNNKDYQLKVATVLIAVGSNNVIMYNEGNYGLEPNAILGLKSLHSMFHTTNHVHEIMVINGDETIIESPQKLREQEEITIKMCADDYDNNYNVNDLVYTQLGWGEVVEDAYLEPYETLTITLKFR